MVRCELKTGCNFDFYSTGDIVALYVELSYILIPYLEEQDSGHGDKKSDDVYSDVADSYSLYGVREICIFFVCAILRQILISIFRYQSLDS